MYKRHTVKRQISALSLGQIDKYGSFQPHHIPQHTKLITLFGWWEYGRFLPLSHATTHEMDGFVWLVGNTAVFPTFSPLSIRYLPTRTARQTANGLDLWNMRAVCLAGLCSKKKWSEIKEEAWIGMTPSTAIRKTAPEQGNYTDKGHNLTFCHPVSLSPCQV